MNHQFKQSLLATAIALALNAPALADPATGSAYFTDRQESFVFDQTSETIGTVNMITCIIDSMNPDELVNAGNYIAMVDMNRCNSDRRSNSSHSSSSGGADSATDYLRATVNSTRASGSSPMRVRGWMESTSDGGSEAISVNISVDSPPTTSNPYGEFRMDYKGVKATGGATLESMRGFLVGSPTGIQWAERETGGGGGGGGPVGKRLYLTKGPADTGAGALSRAEGGTTRTFQFAYNATHFRRAEVGDADRCFDRSLTNANTSVWRYALYNAAGARVERNSGFPIQFVTGGRDYYGYAGFWGVNLPADAMASLTSGSTVTHRAERDGGETTSYTILRSRGRLMKYTRRAATLAQFSGSRFTTQPWGGFSNATANAIVPGATSMTIRPQRLEMLWDNDARAIKVTGVERCNDSGCRTSALTSPVTLTTDDLSLYGVGMFGWSNSFGGPIGISATVLGSIIAGTPTGSVSYRTQDVVYPGAIGAPTTLHCTANCPTASDIAAYLSSAASPFGTTERSFEGALTSVDYSFNPATGDLEAGGIPAVVGGSVTADRLRGTPYQWGFRSGKMVTNLADIACAPGGVTYCEPKAEDLAEYYVWETGPSSWNQFVGLQHGGALVRFDPPLALNYVVPDAPRFGEFRGRTVVLQYEGIGNLQGIPGHCVDPRTNLPAACADGIRFVPRFSIPFDETPDPTSPNRATGPDGAIYYIKWLNREVRFSPAAGSNCTALTLGSLVGLPDVTTFRDPTETASPTYIGPKPIVTAAPRVVDGVTLY